MENNINVSLGLMAKRLGVFSNPVVREEELEANYVSETRQLLDGIESQAQRLWYNGGYVQQNRMIFDKRRSLDRALRYSYQAACVKKIQCTDDIDNSFRPNINKLDEHEIVKVLINPDKNKRDYDDKIISVHYEENFHSGDVFEWLGTNTYWLIYLQDLTETAYFRGEIRRCSYEIEWEDEEGKHSTYAAVRGPVETKIDYIQKHGISVDTPNHSLNILMPRNEETLKNFRRYSKFYLSDVDEAAPQVCWRVEATDWVSTPGILEVTAVEYYANETEDDIDNKIVGGLKLKPTNPNDDSVEQTIKGETFIKPKKVYEYEYVGDEEGEWNICDKFPVKFSINPNNPKQIKVIWEPSTSGQFVITYGSIEKTIVVESLF